MKLVKNKKIRIEEFRDNRGILSVFSSKRNKFKIKRVYFIENRNTKHVRGKHSRKYGAKFYFCLYGKVEINLLSANFKQKIILIKGQMVKIDSKIWIEVLLKTKNTKCVVFDNREYNEKEYIRNKPNYKII